MKLNFPAGFKAYGGATIAGAPSADGSWFFATNATGPRGFGVYVFRQIGDARAQEVNYGPLMPGRGQLLVGGDGILYISGSYPIDADHDSFDNANAPQVFAVPGYVRYTSQGPAPVPIPVVTPVVDQDARAMAQVAKDTANAARKTVLQMFQSSSSANTGRNVLTEKDVVAIVTKTVQTSPLVDWLWQKLKDAAYATLIEQGIVKKR